METYKKVPNSHPTIKFLMGMKIMRPARQVAVQGLPDWECEKESVNRLLDPKKEFLFSFPSPCVSETYGETRKVWNIGNVVEKAMLKGS